MIGEIDGREDELFSLLSIPTEKDFCLASPYLFALGLTS